MQIITETPRLKLAEVTDHDIDMIYLLTSNEKVMEFFPGVLSYDETRQMVRKILNQYEVYGHCFWKVLLKPENTFIGIAGLLHQQIDNQDETEISYRILPEYWNKGYATEAARACREYAEDSLRSKKLISLILPQNHASRKVAQKLGAQKTKSVLFKGKNHDVYVYE